MILKSTFHLQHILLWILWPSHWQSQNDTLSLSMAKRRCPGNRICIWVCWFGETSGARYRSGSHLHLDVEQGDGWHSLRGGIAREKSTWKTRRNTKILVGGGGGHEGEAGSRKKQVKAEERSMLLLLQRTPRVHIETCPLESAAWHHDCPQGQPA